MPLGEYFLPSSNLSHSLHQQLVLPFPWPPPDVVDEPPEFLAEDNEHAASWLEADNRGDSSPHQKGGDEGWNLFIQFLRRCCSTAATRSASS